MLKRVSVSLLAVSVLIGIGRMIILAQEASPAEKPLGGAKGPFVPAVKETAPSVSTPGPSQKPEPAKVPGTDAFVDSTNDEIKIFSLSNAKAEDCLDLIKLVAPTVKCNADVRTNSVVAVGKDDLLSVVEAVLLRLDEQPTPKDPRPRSESKTENPNFAGLPPRDTLRQFLLGDIVLSLQAKPQSKAMLDQLSKLEAKAISQAERIRKALKDSNGGEADIAALRRELDQILAEALRVKFQLEQLQVDALEERLNRVKSQISKRTSATKEIIERRARELIDDDGSRWNTDDPNLDPRSAARVDPTAEPKSNLPLSLDVGIPTIDRPIEQPNIDPRLLPPLLPLPADGFEGNTAATSESGWESFRLASQLYTAQKQLDDVRESLDRARAAKNDDYAARLTNFLASAQKRVNIAKAELDAARRDLELQYEAAQLAVKTAQARSERLSQLPAGTVSVMEVDKGRAELQREKLQQDRLKLRIDLFNKLGIDKEVPTTEVSAPPANDPTKSKPATPTNQPESKNGPRSESVPTPAAPAKPANNPDAVRLGPPINDDWPVPVNKRKIDVPVALKGLGRSGEILADSNDPDEIRRVLNEVAEHIESSNAEECATAMIVWMDRFAEEPLNLRHPSAFISSVIPAMKEIDPATRAKVFLKQLREGGVTVQWTVVKCLSPIRELAATDDFVPLCEEVWKLSSSKNAILRTAALRVLLETVPMTRAGAPEFNSTELQAIVKRLSAAIPVDRVMESLKSALSDADIDLALDVAMLIAVQQDAVPDPTVIAQSMGVLAKICKTAKSPQRYKALKGLAQYKSHSKEVVAMLIELYKAETSTYGATPNRSQHYSKDAIVDSLEQFGPAAKDALPLIEDEFKLIVGRAPESAELAKAVPLPNPPSTKDRLLKAIRIIKAVPRPEGQPQF